MGKIDKIYMTPEQHRKFQKFIEGDDLDFYEKYVINLTAERQEIFFSENPDFMSQYPVSRNRMYLLQDRIFRNILRKIKGYDSMLPIT